MDTSVPCVHCGTFFTPRNRKQNFCSKTECQNARKARWEKHRRKIDPEFRQSRKISQKKWLENNPEYWKDYRRQNPEKAERNRALQKVRNNRRNAKENTPKPVVIAKTDARKSFPVDLFGPFWLIPVIAKTDAVKIYFHTNPTTWP
jgi:hypothetical protein